MQYVELYEVDIVWGAEWRTVTADEIGKGGLLGMEAIQGHRLTIDAFPGGPITLNPLP